jgi:hypothetical protein
MLVPAVPLMTDGNLVTGAILIVVLILLIALIGIKPKTLRTGSVVDYPVRQNGSMPLVVVVVIGSILGVMKLLLVSVL